MKFPRKWFTPLRSCQGNGSLQFKISNERVHSSMKLPRKGFTPTEYPDLVPVNVMAVIKQQPEDFYAGPTSDI
jgi:hypothetical protein